MICQCFLAKVLPYGAMMGITLIELNPFNGLLQSTVLLIVTIKSLLVEKNAWKWTDMASPLRSSTGFVICALGLRDLRSLGGRIQVRTTAYRAGEEVRIALCSGATAELAMKDLEDRTIWATAFIYNDEDKMWRQAGFVEMLVSPAKRDQNEMRGTPKNEVGLKHFKTILKRGHSWWKRDHSVWKRAETWKTRLKRGGGTPWVFFTAAIS